VHRQQDGDIAVPERPQSAGEKEPALCPATGSRLGGCGDLPSEGSSFSGAGCWHAPSNSKTGRDAWACRLVGRDACKSNMRKKSLYRAASESSVLNWRVCHGKWYVLSRMAQSATSAPRSSLQKLLARPRSNARISGDRSRGAHRLVLVPPDPFFSGYGAGFTGP
jgi:hypothetical protein